MEFQSRAVHSQQSIGNRVKAPAPNLAAEFLLREDLTRSVDHLLGRLPREGEQEDPVWLDALRNQQVGRETSVRVFPVPRSQRSTSGRLCAPQLQAAFWFSSFNQA